MTFMNLKLLKVFSAWRNVPKMSKDLAQITQFFERDRNMSCPMRPSIMFHFDTTIPFDPINFKIVQRLNFTQKQSWKIRKFMDPKRTNLIFHRVFEWPFWPKTKKLRRHADSYLRILLSCFESSWTSSKHDAINMMCLFMFLAWRSFGSLGLSLWRLRFHFRP